jgi:hypothetical protein
MNTKFKLGEEIFFMGFNEPVKASVKGIMIIVGEVDTTGVKKDKKIPDPMIVYATGSYSTVEESKAYATKEELQTVLFAKL